MTFQEPDIIEAIPKMKEGVALARPRTRKPKNPEAHAFGERLAQIRRGRGLSQVEFAEKVSMYQADVSDIECGDRFPDTKHIVDFARTLRVSVDELLGLKKVKANGELSESRSVLRRLRSITHLPKRDRQALLRMIDNTLTAAGNGRRSSG